MLKFLHEFEKKQNKISSLARCCKQIFQKWNSNLGETSNRFPKRPSTWLMQRKKIYKTHQKDMPKCEKGDTGYLLEFLFFLFDKDGSQYNLKTHQIMPRSEKTGGSKTKIKGISLEFRLSRTL